MTARRVLGWLAGPGLVVAALTAAAITCGLALAVALSPAAERLWLHTAGQPSTLVLPLLGGVWAITTLILARRPRRVAPDSAPVAGSASGAGAPAHRRGRARPHIYRDTLVLTAVPRQDSRRGGEVRDVQPAPGVPVLAGAESRCDSGPLTLPTTEEGPGCRTPAGRPGPHNEHRPVNVEHRAAAPAAHRVRTAADARGVAPDPAGGRAGVRRHTDCPRYPIAAGPGPAATSPAAGPAAARPEPRDVYAPGRAAIPTAATTLVLPGVPS